MKIDVYRGIVGTVAAAALLAPAARAQGPDALVEALTKVAHEQGGFPGILDNDDRFGASLAPLGDLDGDGNGDLAVGAVGDDTGGSQRGAVYILFMEADGSVGSFQKIADGVGGFGGKLDNGDEFGSALAPLGDVDGDGTIDLAVGAVGDDDGGAKRGAVWILFLETDGTVGSFAKISAEAGGFDGELSNNDRFGSSLALLDSDTEGGLVRLAVGATGDDDGGSQRGAVWILSLESDGDVASHSKISSAKGLVGAGLDNSDHFGSSAAGLGDMDGNGVCDLAVGAIGDDDGGSQRGAVWILFLTSDGKVDAFQKISSTAGGFTGELDDQDHFGTSLALLADLDSSGVVELAVGAEGDDDGGAGKGAVWLLFLDEQGLVQEHLKASQTRGGFPGELENNDGLGTSVAAIRVDEEGPAELATGAIGDDGDDETDSALTNARGATWMLFLRAATETINPGSGINPLVYREGTTPPRLGTTWDPLVDLPTERGDPLFHFMGGALERVPIPMRQRRAFGELLIDWDQLSIFETSPVGTPFEVKIPDDLDLLGLELFTQGGSFLSGPPEPATPVPVGDAGAGPTLSERIRNSTRVELYNGIDVILGF